MWIRRTAYALASLALLVAILLASIYTMSERRFRRTYTVAPENVEAPGDSASIARGAHLALSIGCTECHGEGLSGAPVFDAPPLGRVVALNLTSGRGGVGAQLTPAVIERAVRHGVGPDGRALRIMPSNDFQQISDDDMRSLVAYITHLPPVDNEMAPSHVMLLPRALLIGGLMPLLPAEHMDSATRPMTVAPGPTKEYGYYLATIAGCRNCHGPGLSGGKISAGDPSWPPAMNLTPAGDLAKWTEAEFVNVIRTGKRPDGIPLKLPMANAPRMFGHMSDEELHAIWAYLQSVPPKAYGNH